MDNIDTNWQTLQIEEKKIIKGHNGNTARENKGLKRKRLPFYASVQTRLMKLYAATRFYGGIPTG